MLPCVSLDERENDPSTFGFAMKYFINTLSTFPNTFKYYRHFIILKIFRGSHFLKFQFCDTLMLLWVDAPPTSDRVYFDVSNL